MYFIWLQIHNAKQRTFWKPGPPYTSTSIGNFDPDWYPGGRYSITLKMIFLFFPSIQLEYDTHWIFFKCHLMAYRST